MSTVFRISINFRFCLILAIVGILSLSIIAPVSPLSIDSPGDHPPNPGSDYPWTPANYSSVGDIQAAFNNGRAHEGGGLPTMTLPSQSTWNAMSDNEKALWLINNERQARGVMPLHGFDSNVTSVAQGYADFLLSNDEWGHDKDGTTQERLERNAKINNCHDDYQLWMENIAAFGTSGTSIPLPLERALYNWMYKDSGSSWLHRQMLLHYPFNDNSPPTGKEGLMGIGRASGGPYTIRSTPPVTYDVAEVIVMNAFDPCANWQYDSPQPSVRKVYLPILLGKGSSAGKVLSGLVTYKGNPVQTTVELHYYDGSSWLIATADTNAKGEYEFKDLPKLSGTKKYYVRFWNSNINNSWLSVWNCREITASTTDPSLYRCDFDIENVNLLSPNSEATVSLPQIFSWTKRATTSDSYVFMIADRTDDDPFAWSEHGYVGSANMTELPPVFTPGEQYGWWVRVLGPHGYGNSFYYNNVKFQ